MILSDFHTHSSNSGDSDTPMLLQIESAISKGIKHLCITEHMDMDYPAPPPAFKDDDCDFNLNYDNYKVDFEKSLKVLNNNNPDSSKNRIPSNLKRELADSKNNLDFNLYFGLELGLQTDIVDKNTAFLSGKEFDFIIASSHLVDGEDPYYPDYFEEKSESQAFRRYFEYIYENIQVFDNFDCYGHLDYIVRYGKSKSYSYSDYSDEIDAILKSLIEKGKGIEINTGGLRNGLKYPNPCPDVLRRYKELGGEIITVGSDAHKPEHIAYNFELVPALLTDCGFKYYTIFKNRKANFISI